MRAVWHEIWDSLKHDRMIQFVVLLYLLGAILLVSALWGF
jgi:hypothetical protein